MKYPVLARDLTTVISNWRRHTARVLNRLADDIEHLHAAGLLRASLTELSVIDIDLGDRHDGGQTVSVLRFESGEKIVYKPRDCTVYAVYRKIVLELNDVLPADTQLQAPHVVAGDGYGWVEFIEPADTSDLPRYLRQLGALLAIAHILGASDMHMENVIATADGPIPIDLETLIQNRSDVGIVSYAAQKAVAMLNTSVLGTGILPMHLKTGEGTDIDVSVATGGLNTDSVTAVGQQLVDACTDSMRIELVEMSLGRMKNQPLAMTVAIVRNERAEICKGYENAYRAAMAKNTPLCTILRAHESMVNRYIARPTRSYSLLLTEMRQPDKLRNGIDREALYRSLWSRLSDHPDEAALIAEEERALWKMDVPLFTSRMDSRGLYAGGREIIPNYFASATLNDVEERLEALNETSLRESVRLINEAIIAVAPAPPFSHSVNLSAASTPTEDVDVLTVSRKLARSQAEILVESAIRGEGDATWVSICSSEDSTGFEYQPLGPTLYDGLAGVGLAATFAHDKFTDLGLDDIAHRAMRAVSSILYDWTQGRITLPIGAYSGASGLLYALSHYDAILGKGAYSQLRADAVEHLQYAVAEDRYFDVMAGAAGACAVIATDGSTPQEARQQTLRAMVSHLITHSVMLDDGSRVWETGTTKARLGGFSHGATGIGWALAHAAKSLGDPQIADFAGQALRYDDSLFRTDVRRWVDARPESLALGEAFPVHWCHGAAGIAMARSDAALRLGSEEFFELADIGAQDTLTETLPADDSLCHGSLGNWLALRSIASRANLSDELMSYQHQLLERISLSAVRTGLPEGITSVRGLMLGTAGALYSLCSMQDHKMPNVLLLEPPVPDRQPGGGQPAARPISCNSVAQR